MIDDTFIGLYHLPPRPLPDEAVGVGAVWRNSRPIQQNGLALKAVNTITITGAPVKPLLPFSTVRIMLSHTT